MGGAVGTIVGAGLSLFGANKAAKAQTAAADSAAAAQREETAMTVASQEKMQALSLAAQEKALREQRQYLDPYRTAGTQGLYQYLYRIGAGAPEAGVYQRAMADPSATTRIAELRAKIAAEEAKAQAAAQGGAAAVSPELAALQAELAQLEGAQTPAAEFTPWNLEESPTYRLQMEDTQRAIDRAARARGLYGSGYAMKTSADASRRLAADEQQAQLTRLTGLTSMGQEASAGMAGSGLASANAMTNLYGQGAQTLASAYQNQATGVGNAAYASGGAKAGVWGNVGQIGGALMSNSMNSGLYGSRQPSAPQTASTNPASTAAGLASNLGFSGWVLTPSSVR